MVSLVSTMRRAKILCFESRVIDQQCYHVDREPGSVTLIVQSRISGHIYVVSVLAPLSVGGGTVPLTYRHDPFQACSHICYQLPVMEGNTSCVCYISQARHMRVPKRGSEISLNFLDAQLSREIMLPRCAGRGEEGGGGPVGRGKCVPQPVSHHDNGTGEAPQYTLSSSWPSRW